MRFPAHIRIQKDGTQDIQTVGEHCRGTARCAAECLSDIGLSHAAYLAGLLHDLGKATPQFRAYIERAANGESVRRGAVVHTFAGARLLLEQHHGPEPVSYDDITCELLAFAIGAHHGLFDCAGEARTSGFQHRLLSHDSEYHESVQNFLNSCAGQDEIDSLFRAACLELTAVFEKIQDRLCSDAALARQELPFYVGLMARLLLSAVIQGDRRDTAEFMTGVARPPSPEDRRPMWEACLQRMERKLERFPSETDIQKARRQISDQCRLFAEQPGGIYRLNVPTGAGKTLSSLRYALAHAAQWNKSRIIFTAPLLTILEQNAQVIRDYVGDDSMILEHHSNLVRTQEEPEQLDLQELLAEDWSAPIIITTLVQLLNTLFSGKTTSIRRFQSLADSVIILDEVQTVPTKMLTLFNLAVNFLTEICGATVVLCSATQPCLEKAAHPLASVPKDIVPYDRELWSAFCRTQIRNAGNLRLEDLPAFALKTLEKANSLLIVCNKKDQAAYLYQKLSGCGFCCCHLSAAMCTAHRRAALAGLQAALAAGEKTVCVSTQVIEAGVDISFERVIRLSAGMDSVVQAAGRCNRNGEQTGPAPVCLVQCQNENLARLPDIQRGKDATAELLAQYRQRPEQFRNDLSSDEAIGYYYRRLYQEMPEGFQDYRIQDKHYTIFSLLADNTYFSDDRAEAHGTYFLNQAFQLAGKLFQVYDEDSIDVIVPYGEGRTVIADLGSDRAGRDLAYRKSCLDRAKPYTVSLYQYQRQQLERDHGLLPIRDGDDSVRVLAEGFYDEKTGLSLSGTAAQFWEV